MNQKSVPLSCCLLMMLLSCTPATIRIGYIGSFSTKAATPLITARNGAMLAVEDMNEQGGINGTPIELVMRDDKNDPALTLAFTRELVEKKVTVIILGTTSRNAILASAYCSEQRMVCVSPTVASESFFGKDDYLILFNGSTGEYGPAVARTALSHARVSSVCIVLDSTNAEFSENLSRYFTEAFVKGGGKVTATISFASRENMDFAQTVRTAMDTRAQAIFIIANPLDTAMICQNLRLSGSDAVFLLSTWSTTDIDLLLRHAGTSINGSYYCLPFDYTSTRPEWIRFASGFHSRFETAATYVAAAAYESIVVLGKCLSAAPAGTQGQELKARLIGRKFTGLQEPVEIDGYGDAHKPIFSFVLKEGRPVTLPE